MRRPFGILFKCMWQFMHSKGYFARHPHYRDWIHEGRGPRSTADSWEESYFHQLDFSRNEIIFPGNYSDELERAIKRHEEYWLPRMFEIPATGSVVDLGCGFGRSAEWLQHRYSRVVGVDISRRLLRQARGRFRESSNVEFLLGDGLALPPQIEDSSIDLIYSFTVFQHIPRSFVEGYLADFKRKIRNGGSVVFNVLAGINERKRLGMPFVEWSIGYDPAEIRKFIEVAGLQIAKEVRWRLAEGSGYWVWFHLHK